MLPLIPPSPRLADQATPTAGQSARTPSDPNVRSADHRRQRPDRAHAPADPKQLTGLLNAQQRRQITPLGKALQHHILHTPAAVVLLSSSLAMRRASRARAAADAAS